VPVIGFGLGSHSFDGFSRYANSTDPENYLLTVETGRLPEAWRKKLTSMERLEERFFLGLRLSGGINIAQTHASIKEQGIKRQIEDIIQHLLGEQLLEQEGSYIRLTNRGMLLSNEVFQSFLDLDCDVGDSLLEV
jgi:oxygen-independent coproporphyrinogen-3 oxidase